MERTAILVTAIISLTVTGVSGFFVIPMLRRLKYGQIIKEIGPTWHKSKEGLPTMGGVMIIFGVVTALAVGYITLILEAPHFLGEQFFAENIRFYAGLGLALLMGLMGFIDDMMKIKRKNNLGLRARYKLILQLIFASAYIYVLTAFGAASTMVKIPFIGEFEFGKYYYILAVLMIAGFTNAVNITDGIDGLASSITFVVSLAYIVISILLGYVATGLMSTALAGAMAGFIVWNFHPAKVILGDTGSMFLGGMLSAMAFSVDFPALMIIAGGVFFIEAFSVMLQMTWFKITKLITGKGRRIFKMSPIHHHFEMCGMSEIMIVSVFSLVTLILCVISVLAVNLL
ncbi:MAG: phospho-N-acetylmuramoyl-pentapeptide-transferase [Ruminococcaceae bacterium]|nr:phospho-N-acetylmuramoyl-pentapeptide-transferase [Oscillospiraceae bacterium]